MDMTDDQFKFELEHLPKPKKQFTSGGQEDLTSTEDE